MDPRNRKAGRYPVIAVGWVVLVIVTVASAAVATGAIAARLVASGSAFAVALGATVTVALAGGLTAAPVLGRRIGATHRSGS